MDDFPDILATFYGGFSKLLELPRRNSCTNPTMRPPRKSTDEHRKREAESSRIRAKYPDRVPIVIITHGDLKIDKAKFLAPGDLTFGQLMYTVKKRLALTDPQQLSQSDALYGMVGNRMIPTAKLLSQIYENSCHTDGMMYVDINRENTFGSFG